MRTRRVADGRLAAVAIAFVTIATSCVGSDQGLDIQKLQADLSFGVRELTTDAPPANFSPPAESEDLEEIQFPEHTPPPFLTPAAAAVHCPDAAINEFPDRVAPEVVEGKPAAGTYRWKILRGSELRLEKRYLRKVEEISEREFTYETLQTDTTGVISVTKWRVNSGGISQGVGGGSGTTRRRYGESDAGISIERIDRYSAGRLVGTFQPVSPVLYFPLPIAQGEEWTSTGIDINTGQSLEHSGKVIRRERVDACGDVVEGWLVEGAQSFRGADGDRARKYDYIVGLAEGGVLLSERIETLASQGKPTVTTYELGQVKPDALEKGLPG